MGNGNPTPVSPEKVLRQVFGYPKFRPGQEEIIHSLLGRRDVLAIMPTGGGKSLCYQIPALLLPGVTLVVSPLISLMIDQVQALVQLGVHAAYLNSALTPKQLQRALDNACSGAYQIIYLAPERLNTPSIRRLAASVEISMVCVDEAHCVSQWGQDFRPSYLEIPKFVESLPRRPVVAAFTATATPSVQQDTQKMLRLRSPSVTVTGFDRPNLYFAVQHPSDKRTALLGLVNKWKERSGIVYCTTRKDVESVCETLCAAGFAATRYHAGLEPEERTCNQEDFLYDRKTIIVATNAFGMGIDKSNVAYVIHYSMPRDMESYYQEAGRAGRDGSPAACVLLYEPRDSRMCRYLNNLERENDELDEATRKQLQRQSELRLQQMERYVNTSRCLRQTLLEYFGEESRRPCGNCSVCLARAKEKAARRSGVFSTLFNGEKRRQNAALLEALREARHGLARRYGVIPANIFTDATLRQMAAERPRSEAEFLEISGVTRVKYKQYGETFAKVIAQYEEGEG